MIDGHEECRSEVDRLKREVDQLHKEIEELKERVSESDRSSRLFNGALNNPIFEN